MLEIIESYRIGTEIIGRIKNAKNEILLISPYIKLWGHLRAELELARNRDVGITAYIREPQGDYKSERDKFAAVTDDLIKLGIKQYSVPDLHAKIYLLDDTAIVSSMNLYDYSQSNSIELAILIEDADTVQEIRKFISEYIVPKGKLVEEKQTPATGSVKAFCTQCGKQIEIRAGEQAICNTCLQAERAKTPKKERATEGYCIRCGKEIKLNPERPLCYDCYKKWAEHDNPTYPEKHCHECGKKVKTTLAKPLCSSCYKGK